MTSLDRTLAEGGFSIVYVVKDSRGKRYALKRIYCDDTDEEQHVQWEIQVHRSIDHPNVMRLLDADIIDAPTGHNPDKRAALLLFPLLNRGSLQDWIMKSDDKQLPLSTEVDCLEIFAEICLGLRAMHRNGWAHCDIKPHNVLLQDPELAEQQVGIPGRECLQSHTWL